MIPVNLNPGVLLALQLLRLGHLEISTSKFKCSNATFSVKLEPTHRKPATR